MLGMLGWLCGGWHATTISRIRDHSREAARARWSFFHTCTEGSKHHGNPL